jgi:hypothetical protein
MHDTTHPETEPLEAGAAQPPLIVLSGSRVDLIWRIFEVQLHKSQEEWDICRVEMGEDRAGPDDTQQI